MIMAGYKQQHNIWPLLFLLLTAGLSACGSSQTGKQTPSNTPFADQPRNVILMIGDGMGLTQISAALYANNNRLFLEEFPIVGLHKQHSSNNLITDSAAGATAFACGVKTYNDAIGVDKDTLPVTNLIEICRKKGMSTGIVVSSSLAHATPAAFYAHQRSRVMKEEIALDLMTNRVDFLVGGGLADFNERSIDNRNLIDEMRTYGYQISTFLEDELPRTLINTRQPFVYFTARNEPLSSMMGRDYLPIAARLATAYLDNRAANKGFFLMVEGSQIDWAGHAKRGPYLISEALDFNETIGEVLRFAKRNRETLVIVTADHETGGTAIQPDSKLKNINLAFTGNAHTASMVPVFAFGPGAEAFAGIYENTDINRKIKAALSLDTIKVGVVQQ